MALKPKPFKRAGSSVYSFRYYTDDGKRRWKSTGETRKDRAEAFVDQFLKSLGERPPLVFKQIADRFYTPDGQWAKAQKAMGRKVDAPTLKWRQGIVDNHLIEMWGDYRIDEIRKKAVRDWLLSLELSNQTRKHIVYTLKYILDEAVDDGRLDRNPLEGGIGFNPASTKKARDTITKEEFALLVPEDSSQSPWSDHKYAVIALLLWETGMRSGEAISLKWRSIVDECWLDVHQSKTGADKLCYLPARSRKALADWRAFSKHTAPEDWIFYGRNKYHHVVNSTMSKEFQKAVAQLEAADKFKRTGRNIVLHSLRHSFSTMMDEVLPRKVSMLLTGHASEKAHEGYNHADRLQELRKELEPFSKQIEQVFS